MRLPLIALSAALWLLATTAVARGQVVIDPDSPSAKEYAIPLENERRQADPETAPQDGVTQGERSSPLFGSGIEETPGPKERRDDARAEDDTGAQPQEDERLRRGDA